MVALSTPDADETCFVSRTRARRSASNPRRQAKWLPRLIDPPLDLRRASRHGWERVGIRRKSVPPHLVSLLLRHSYTLPFAFHSYALTPAKRSTPIPRWLCRSHSPPLRCSNRHSNLTNIRCIYPQGMQSSPTNEVRTTRTYLPYSAFMGLGRCTRLAVGQQPGSACGSVSFERHPWCGAPAAGSCCP